MATKKTKANVTTTAGTGTNTKKSTKVNKATDKKNVKQTIKKVVKSKREIKYNYPATMSTDVLKKKAFRQKVRNQIRTFERQIAKAENEKAKARLEAKYKTYREEVLLVP